MWEALIHLIDSLANYPWAILGMALIGVIALAIRMALANPKFWDLLVAHLSVNTALTKETREDVKTLLAKQGEQDAKMRIMEATVATRDDQLTIKSDVAGLKDEFVNLREEVDSLQKVACGNINCPNRKVVEAA